MSMRMNMRKKLLAGSMVAALALSALFSEVPAEALEGIWAIADENGTTEYETYVPEEVFDEVFFFEYYNPEISEEEIDSYYTNWRVAYHWLDIAYENGLFEEEMVYETKENGREVFMPDTEQVNSLYQEEYPEEVEEFGKIYTDATVPFQMKLCIVFYDEETENSYKAILFYSTDEDSGKSVSDETISTIIDNFRANGEEVEKSTESDMEEETEFSEEAFEETASYTGTWVTFQNLLVDTEYYSIYLPELWYDISDIFLTESLLQAGYVAAFSPLDDSGEIIDIRLMSGAYSVDSLSASESFRETYGFSDDEEIESTIINGIPAVYTEVESSSGTILTMHFISGSGVNFMVELFSNGEYADYADTLFNSVHLADMDMTDDEETTDTEETANTESGAGSESSCENDTDIVREVQQALNKAGYDCGTADGIAGSKTTQAILSFQEDNGLEADGLITDSLLEALGIQ
ncbi:MAG: peptidoglycan-binding protein [Lachnospiraceae bacterium]|nr:peptidoglycan-binding protein [Lachnospiraceae bacterium]